jgi:transcriptional regulator with XRE-family HTH domain
VKGRELRRWRAEQFLSQGELAALLGVHYTSVANWETGRADPPEEMLDLALEAISARRERQVRAMWKAKERLAHMRRLKAIAQGLPERRAAARAASQAATP